MPAIEAAEFFDGAISSISSLLGSNPRIDDSS
jgi:hypothetical protein